LNTLRQTFNMRSEIMRRGNSFWSTHPTKLNFSAKPMISYRLREFLRRHDRPRSHDEFSWWHF
jgi:hypothetical protein